MMTAPAEGYPMPVPQHPYGCRIEDIPNDIKTWDGWRPTDMVPFDNMPPLGWYSFGHWTALTEPAMFAFLEEPLPDVLAEEEARIGVECRKQGIEPFEWPAPPALAAVGIETVLLFPDPILRDMTRC